MTPSTASRRRRRRNHWSTSTHQYQSQQWLPAVAPATVQHILYIKDHHITGRQIKKERTSASVELTQTRHSSRWTPEGKVHVGRHCPYIYKIWCGSVHALLRYRSKTTKMQKFLIDSYSNENIIYPFFRPPPRMPLTPNPEPEYARMQTLA